MRAVAAAGNPSRAAIGTRLAGRLYGCVLLAEGIEDAADNTTRFVWLAGRGERAEIDGGASGPRPMKTSVVFWGAGTGAPGWLVRCLSEFAFRGVSLTRIESRPRRVGLGTYMFFLDLEGAAGDPAVAEAIEGLRTQTDHVRVLGSFAPA